MRCQGKLKNSRYRCKRDCLRGKYCWQHKQSGGRRRQSGGSSGRRQSTSSRKQSTSSRRKRRQSAGSSRRRQSGGLWNQMGGGLDDKISCNRANGGIKCNTYTFQSDVCPKNTNKRKSNKVYKCQKGINNEYECKIDGNDVITDYYCPNIEYKLTEHQITEVTTLPFKLDKKINEAGSAEIYEAIYNNDIFVVKKTKSGPNKFLFIQSFLKEAKIIRYLNAEKDTGCIVQLANIYKHKDDYYLVLEHLGEKKYVTLYDVVNGIDAKKYNKFSYTQLLMLMETIALCVEKIHALGVVHFDLTPGNIMIDLKAEKRNQQGGLVRCYDAKIIDFGLSCYKDECKTSQYSVGTTGYESPEYKLRHLRQFYDIEIVKKSDIWALMMVYLYIIFGDHFLSMMAHVWKYTYSDNQGNEIENLDRVMKEFAPRGKFDKDTFLSEFIGQYMNLNDDEIGIFDYMWQYLFKEGLFQDPKERAYYQIRYVPRFMNAAISMMKQGTLRKSIGFKFPLEINWF